MDRDSHNALLAEVDGLKTTLEGVRQDLQGLMVFQERCEQQDNIQETVRDTPALGLCVLLMLCVL